MTDIRYFQGAWSTGLTCTDSGGFGLSSWSLGTWMGQVGAGLRSLVQPTAQ